MKNKFLKSMFFFLGVSLICESSFSNPYQSFWSLVPLMHIKKTSDNVSREWADGTQASSCNEYLNPKSKKYVYRGETGSGVYRLKIGSKVFDAYCDQVLNGGGWTLVVGFNGLGVDLGTNVVPQAWNSPDGYGVFKNTNLNYDYVYFSPAYGNMSASKIRIDNGYDYLTWTTPLNSSLHSLVWGSSSLNYWSNTETGWAFDSSLSSRVSSNYTNLGTKWNYPLKIRCIDSTNGGAGIDYQVIGFKSTTATSGVHFCEGFGVNHQSLANGTNSRWAYQTVTTGNIVYQPSGWRSDSLYYKIWVK